MAVRGAVFAALVIFLLQSSVTTSLPASGGTCDAAKSLMASLKLPSNVEVPASPIPGGSGSVCSESSGERTCCPAGVESALRQSAASDLHEAVRRSSQPLRLALAQSAATIQGQIVQSVKASMSKTQTMFGQLYQRLSLLAHAPIRQLFDRLERFVSKSGSDEDPADVSDAVAAFFDDLFPRLHGQSPRTVNQGPPLPANTLGLKLNQDYVDCLRHAQSELRPFGEIPRRLANSLARSLDAVRALLSALDLGVQVLNATDHAELNGQCRDALLRATYCAQCRGLVTSPEFRVCRGLCSNVARGCLAAVADVDQPWNEWVDALERLASTLLHHVNKENPISSSAADLSAQDVLSSVDSRLSEAVLYALENGPLLEKKVKRICGEGQNSSVLSSVATEEAPPIPVAPAATALDSSIGSPAAGLLTSGLESLLPALASARGFYANLPDAVCALSGSPFTHSSTGQQPSARNDDQTNCWNGQRFAEYTKPISGIGIGAQKYNAEVRVSRSDVDSHLVQLSDRLRHVRQVLISKTVASPEPDSLVMADFGSGSGDGANSNGVTGTGRSGSWEGDSEPDEDGLGGPGHSFTDVDMEGSGSGMGPTDSDWSNSRGNKGDGRSGSNKKPGGSDEFDLNGGDATPTRGTSVNPSSSSRTRPSTLVSLCFLLAASYSSIRRIL